MITTTSWKWIATISISILLATKESTTAPSRRKKSTNYSPPKMTTKAIFFAERGIMANTERLMTFHFDINLDQVSDELRNFRTTMETSIDSTLTKLRNSPTLTKAFTAFRDEYLSELQLEQDDILNIESLARMAYHGISRTKREIVTITSALVAGIVSLTSVIVVTLSSYAVNTANKNTARLNDIELKQQRQHDLVKELNAAFNLELQATDVNESDLNNKVMMLNEISNLRNKFRGFQHSRKNLSSAIRKLIMGSVDPRIVPTGYSPKPNE